MKYQFLSVLLLAVGLAMSGCDGNASGAISLTATIESPVVEDQSSLIAALQKEGAKVEVGEPVTQVFFSPAGTIIKVNGADVQVFEYERTEAMENEASQVAPDGGSIGTTMVTWVDSPHFYKAGRIIALYIGSDERVLGLLEKLLGPQFAGQ